MTTLLMMSSLQIETICRSEDDDSDTVEECLKMQFNKGNPEMREECRVEIADLIEEARADIHFDPLLHKACSNDVAKYCSDVAQGNGRRKSIIIVLDDDLLKSKMFIVQPNHSIRFLNFTSRVNRR